ncbi:DUF2400 family protein [Williamwhitmania taraxaci]|uniref:DUF2400 family protein n=1 Tax=Williamwhitmania taraxaci TaxID=1640674 RepID=UPI00147C1253
MAQYHRNKWHNITEISNVLRSFSPEDPVKYDFALFYIGMNKEHFSYNVGI